MLLIGCTHAPETFSKASGALFHVMLLSCQSPAASNT